MERRKIICWDDPKASARDAALITGLDYLKAIKAGRINPPPVAMLVGYQICEIDKGYALYTLDPHEYHYNPFAMVHGGIITTVLDTAMVAAVLSTLGRGESCSTAELKVNFIRPVTGRTGILRCEARPIHVGKHLATTEGELKDREDNLYAHAVGTCFISRSGGKTCPGAQSPSCDEALNPHDPAKPIDPS